MKGILSNLVEVIDTSGTIAKKQVLGRYKADKEMGLALNLAFNPFLVTGIASKKLSKDITAPIQQPSSGRKSLLGGASHKEEGVVDIDLTFESLLIFFTNRHTGTDNDILSIQRFMSKAIKEFNLSFREAKVLEDIITKSLTLGINVKSINEIWETKLIPTFECQLGTKLEDCEKLLEGKYIMVTEKLDGNRCICVVESYYNEQISEMECTAQFFSRNGKEIEGLESIGSVMKTLPDGVYDGELIADDFNQTQSIIRTQGTKNNLVYNIFDYVASAEDFFDSSKKEVGGRYEDRRNKLNEIFQKYGTEDGYIGAYKNVKNVPVLGHFIYNKESVMRYHDMIKSQGGEGVMINVDDAPYIKDRTKLLVKVKAMKTCDVMCKGIENGDGRLANTLGFIVCDYKGYELRVGSGFDDASRDYYYKNPDKIVNHLVEVQYFEETTNQDGTVSLRFPVFLQVRDDKDEESYN